MKKYFELAWAIIADSFKNDQSTSAAISNK